MKELAIAVRAMQVLYPAYFRRGPKRLPTGIVIPRPNLLTSEEFNTRPLADIVAPPSLAKDEVDVWFDRFSEIACDNLLASPFEVAELSTEMAARSSLNARQRSWLLPATSACMAAGPSILLAYTLYGALRAGASVAEIGRDTFLVEHAGQRWGVHQFHVFGTNDLVPPINFADYINGRYRWGAKACRSGAVVRAYRAAHREGNRSAKQVISAAYWNVGHTTYLEALFTPLCE